MHTTQENKSYIEYIDGLRAAFKLVASKIPEVIQAANDARNRRAHEDPDLDIIFMSDDKFNSMLDSYYEIEPKLYMFDPEQEYGWRS